MSSKEKREARELANRRGINYTAALRELRTARDRQCPVVGGPCEDHCHDACLREVKGEES